MPCYFMRDMPLQALEQLMMSQPGQKPRGGGIYRSPFHYTPKDVLLDMEQENLADLNALAQAADELSSDDMKKLGAVITLAKPQNAEQIKNLVENLDLFDFAPGAHTPEEYGRYMIQQSGHFDYDENLDEFYDYEGYAMQRMNEEDGMFTGRGYIAYIV